MKKNNLTIGYAGMSHLGINSSIAAAQRVASVIAYDEKKEIINSLSLNNTIVDEPNLKMMMREFKHKIKYTCQLEDLKQCDIVYISQDVPTNKKGKSNFTRINKLIKKVNKAIGEDTILVILCQVPPGFTRKINRPSNKLFYQVETLIFGKAIERATKPERIILGCFNNDHYISPRLNEFLKTFSCPILPMIYESAELAKTAINVVLASQVSVANSLAEICEKTEGDWNEVIPALNLDKRIGHHAYLSTGLGISGGNIERDLKTLSEISKKFKCNNSFLESIIGLSNYRKKWAQNLFKKENKKNQINNVTILGLAYKLETNSVKNSPSLELINYLENIKIKVYDPIIKEIRDNEKVIFCNSVYEAIIDADMLFIMLPYKEFQNLNWNKVFKLMKLNIIVDPFRVIDRKNKGKNITHYILGKN